MEETKLKRYFVLAGVKQEGDDGEFMLAEDVFLVIEKLSRTISEMDKYINELERDLLDTAGILRGTNDT